MKTTLSHFQIVRPRFISTQRNSLKWLQKAHLAAEKYKHPKGAITEDEISKEISHVCCKSPTIATRSHVLQDYCHTNWEKMTIYNLTKQPQGAYLGKRNEIFEKSCDEVFQKFYPQNATSPDDLIHVTCTGYCAPSPAQKIVSQKGWNTEVTHLYHMGCYAAVSAIRVANGLIKAGKSHVDIAHTEICSLHTNPSSHQRDQLVAQSLFADGFIRYKMSNSETKGLELMAVKEQVIPNSSSEMKWNLSEWGFEIALSKKIPVYLARNVEKFITSLSANMDFSWKNALFAIHPGGPKIINQIQEVLSLKEEQISASKKILQTYGNISSATLPHIWAEILQDQSIASNTPIISLAFGPGLTICGAVFFKK